jgi:hypothetical protein
LRARDAWQPRGLPPVESVPQGLGVAARAEGVDHDVVGDVLVHDPLLVEIAEDLGGAQELGLIQYWAQAALALWRYSEESVAWIFEDASDPDTENKILRAVVRKGRLADTDISGLFHRNVPAERLTRAKANLERDDLGVGPHGAWWLTLRKRPWVLALGGSKQADFVC